MSAACSPRDLFEVTATLCEEGGRFAILLVLRTEGSAPREAGARAVLEADGTLHGTIGGGAVEAEALRQARQAIASGTPVVFDFPLEGETIEGCAPVCGGVMRVLVDPAACQHRRAYAAAAAALDHRQPGTFLTIIRSGNPPSVETEFLDETAIRPGLPFPGYDAIRLALVVEQACWHASLPAQIENSVEVLVEPVLPRPRLLIAGGGHIGQALAAQAAQVGFEIVVVDDRPEFTAPALFPEGVATLCGNIAETVAACRLDTRTYVVIVTRGHQHDAAVLQACLPLPAAYLGMIGSRRKVALMRQAFLQSGRATQAQWDRIHTPIGLDIGAVTVPEIAVSILAELVAVRRQAEAGRRPLG